MSGEGGFFGNLSAAYLAATPNGFDPAAFRRAGRTRTVCGAHFNEHLLGIAPSSGQFFKAVCGSGALPYEVTMTRKKSAFGEAVHGRGAEGVTATDSLPYRTTARSVSMLSLNT